MFVTRILNQRKTWLASLLVAAALLLAACSPAASTPAATVAVPSTGGQAMVSVTDQAIVDGTVTIAKVVSSGPGWIVIHIDNNGAPGPVIGEAAVANGDNANVKVTIDTSKATEKLFAMLHTDAGTVGTYEFPGADVPVKSDGAMVNPSFMVTGLPSSGAAPTEPAASGPVAVSIISGGFDPHDLTIKAGTTVVWTNTSGTAHTVTADDGSFDSGSLAKGDTFQFTFDKAGTFPYYCSFHGGPGGVGMSATVTVTP